ncbi:MAG: biotin--[acetyl-CoA-carboxylase] ligase [Flavisolibacter sp.]
MSSLNPIGIPFIELPTVDSTNNYAMGLVREAMAQHGTAVFAHEQTKGKGQRNRHWESQKNQNIALSVILEPKSFDSSTVFLLSMAIANSVYDFLQGIVIDNLTIKWPNDVYWCDRKAAGILIENLWQGNEWKFAVVGIGINVNQKDFGELQNKAVSLKQICGNEFDPLVLTKELCKQLQNDFSSWQIDKERIISTYKTRLYKLNESVKFRKKNRVFEAIVSDVSQSGQLVVQHGVEEIFDVGEVEWVI